MPILLLAALGLVLLGGGRKDSHPELRGGGVRGQGRKDPHAQCDPTTSTGARNYATGAASTAAWVVAGAGIGGAVGAGPPGVAVGAGAGYLLGSSQATVTGQCPPNPLVAAQEGLYSAAHRLGESGTGRKASSTLSSAAAWVQGV